jgi:hypothetical protein
MLGIVPVEGVGIDENGCGFLKGDAVFLEVVGGIVGVPREHICVYTVIRRDCKWGIEWTGKTRGETEEKSRSLAPLGMTNLAAGGGAEGLRGSGL